MFRNQVENKCGRECLCSKLITSTTISAEAITLPTAVAAVVVAQYYYCSYY